MSIHGMNKQVLVEPSNPFKHLQIVLFHFYEKYQEYLLLRVFLSRHDNLGMYSILMDDINVQ